MKEQERLTKEEAKGMRREGKGREIKEDGIEEEDK